MSALMRTIVTAWCVAAAVIPLASHAQDSEPAPTSDSPDARWQNGPPESPDYFPIGVWLQSPSNAGKYKAAGFNLYIGLWKGPTEEQIAELRKHDMPVFCTQNEYALAHLDEPLIVGWMHGDEPDNAQPRKDGPGYGPPIPPEEIIADYEDMRKADPTRPVLLNLGQGVAWDEWHGRGVRTKHPEDYPRYIRGCDIASFDIYPAVHGNPAVAGKLWYVARGVRRLRQWAPEDRIVWNCIECTRIRNPDVKPSPHQVRAEAWMSIIHGSRGLIYFVHQWVPEFREAGLLGDSEMLEAVTDLNHQIAELAPVINAPEPAPRDRVREASTNEAAPIAAMTRQFDGATYVFAVCLREETTEGVFTLPEGLEANAAQVLGEGRSRPINDRRMFRDDFRPYDVHLYRIAAQ